MLDSAQLLFDLQRINRLAQAISGCLDPQAIAKGVTDALISQFNCAFARMWLMEPTQDSLRLVSSSGLYTHTNGFFARVPLGAYKVGKIAQNRVPFLSNCLADETWVKDRQWAIDNNILGFAGYPLLANDRVLGVLATFSHHPMAPEFLEVLQVLCLTTTIALDAALQVQQSQASPPRDSRANLSTLSDQLAALLPSTRLMLVGTERPLTPYLTYTLIYTAEILREHHCRYCRLTYAPETITLEALLGEQPADLSLDSQNPSPLEALRSLVNGLGGTITVQPGDRHRVFELFLELPYCYLATSSQPAQPDIVVTSPLSDREQKVLQLLVQGLRDRDIGEKLFISPSTVKFHLNNVMGKLGAKNRYQAVYQATIQGLI